MNANLKAELVEVFTEQVASTIRATYNNLINRFGDNLKGIYNTTHSTVWSEMVSPCCVSNGNRISSTYSLSEERLNKFVALVAESMTNDVLAKVNLKVGSLDNANVVHVGNANFVINGQKNENAVVIEQNQIINVSVKGKFFNQYPSRIYLNGKFISAAKFAKL